MCWPVTVLGPMSTQAMAKTKMHYAWIVAAVTFFILLITAGIRATPSILMVPLQHEFGWTTAAISGAIAINIALFGIIGPFAASFMSRYGVRKIVLLALAILACGVAGSSLMPKPGASMRLYTASAFSGSRSAALRLPAADLAAFPLAVVKMKSGSSSMPDASHAAA